jgi:hypothetical protein
MRILITGEGTFIGDKLVIGKYYNYEPADTGSLAQGRAFHSLLQTFWASGLHSYIAKSFQEFKDYIKRDLGAGAEYYVYVKKDGLLRAKTKDRDEAVQEAAVDRYGRPVVWMRLKSWADYTKKERTETIDLLISEMHQVGVQTKKFYEILKGMEKNRKVREG